MTRNNKTKFAAFFSLLVTIILCFAFFAAPVSAEDGEGSPNQKGKQIKLMYLKGAEHKAGDSGKVVPEYRHGRWLKMHSDARVFNRNYQLSQEEKEYTITEIDKVISEIRNSSKSDLEKYYKIAIWLNKYVNYDWEFWPSGYDLGYYSHQWDAYGVLKEQKSICAGIAVTYATLCHAADLPCKFVRMDPGNLDHTINYIPDINGHAYYIDVTENLMFMSDKANPWDPLDIKFSCIDKKKIPDDGSLEYFEDGTLHPSTIKEYYNTPFDEWFREYALHENTEKEFKTEYVEKGSGNGEYHASYKDYPKQFSYTEKPGIWFLEDFYQDPKTIETKILNKELDEQLLNISGVKGNYDCDTPEELESAVAGDMAVKYFPSSENGKVVATAAGLTVGKDYTVTCDAFDALTGEAKLTITGTGAYCGSYQIPVRIHSAAITKAPVNKKLVYTGEPQALVEPGEAAGNSKILYAVREFDTSKAYPDVFDNKSSDPKNAPDPEQFSEEIPVATNAGQFEVWYMIKGTEGHIDVQPQRLKGVAIIAPIESKILAEDVTVKEGNEIKLTPVLDTGLEAEYWYDSYDYAIAPVNKDGVVKGVAAGTTKIGISAKLNPSVPNYKDLAESEITVTVTDNPYYIEDAKVVLSDAEFTYNAKVQKPSIETIKGQKLEEGTDYTTTWSNAFSKNAGKYTVTIEGKGKYTGTTQAKYKIIKAANPMTLKGGMTKVKHSKIKHKAITIKRAKVITLNKAKGKQKYKLVTVKKGKKSFKKYFRVNAKTGNVTVKKGLKKGKYTVKARVRAAGNTNYLPSAWKTVTFKVKVK